MCVLGTVRVYNCIAFVPSIRLRGTIFLKETSRIYEIRLSSLNNPSMENMLDFLIFEVSSFMSDTKRSRAERQLATCLWVDIEIGNDGSVSVAFLNLVDLSSVLTGLKVRLPIVYKDLVIHPVNILVAITSAKLSCP